MILFVPRKRKNIREGKLVRKLSSSVEKSPIGGIFVSGRRSTEGI